ncbi:hypothetical protein GmHk_17G049269 [Glycine max]|nr:hypothetical protein GmHk_17G049269 [Glycine max]
MTKDNDWYLKALHWGNKGHRVEFEILEASDSRTKKKILQTVGEMWMKWTLAETLHGRVCEKRDKPSRSKTLPPTCCLVGSGGTNGIIDPLSPIRRHMKWNMARTKKTRQMTSELAKEITQKIVSHFQLTIATIFVYYVNAFDKYAVPISN